MAGINSDAASPPILTTLPQPDLRGRMSVVSTLQVLFSFVWMPGVAALCSVYCVDGRSAPNTPGLDRGTAAGDQAAGALTTAHWLTLIIETHIFFIFST